METENVILMRMARESLSDKWGLAIGTFIIYSLITVTFLGLIEDFNYFGIFSLIIEGPFALGLTIFSLAISRNQEAKVVQLFYGFNLFWKALGAFFITTLFISIGFLLFVIPGIIAALYFSLTFYILADDHSVGVLEAIERSCKMMQGFKMKCFCLYLRFLGLAFLCLFTFGIGFFFLFPYIEVVMAHFYEDVKNAY